MTIRRGKSRGPKSGSSLISECIFPGDGGWLSGEFLVRYPLGGELVEFGYFKQLHLAVRLVRKLDATIGRNSHVKAMAAKSGK